MFKFANPKKFDELTTKLQPWFLALAIVFLAVGFYAALFVAPPDYQQGDSARIMYVHVPSSWLALMAYGVMAFSSLCGFVWRHPLGFLSSRAVAPIGATMAFISLATGAIWGVPTWGTYWVWDARLTSMLVLFFLYLGYMAMMKSFQDVEKGDKVGGILCLVGVINLPIIKFSVEWWNTLHQSSSINLNGSAIHSSMLWPLLVMAIGFTFLFSWLALLRIQLEVDRRRLHIRILEKVFAGGD